MMSILAPVPLAGNANPVLLFSVPDEINEIEGANFSSDPNASANDFVWFNYSALQL